MRPLLLALVLCLAAAPAAAATYSSLAADDGHVSGP